MPGCGSTWRYRVSLDRLGVLLDASGNFFSLKRALPRSLASAAFSGSMYALAAASLASLLASLNLILTLRSSLSVSESSNAAAGLLELAHLHVRAALPRHALGSHREGRAVLAGVLDGLLADGECIFRLACSTLTDAWFSAWGFCILRNV